MPAFSAQSSRNTAARCGVGYREAGSLPVLCTWLRPNQGWKQWQHFFCQFLDDLLRRAPGHLHAQRGMVDPCLAPRVQQLDQPIAAGAQHVATL
ncbi:hypothetical protein D3C77_662110 [compost metagenome]